MSPYHSEWKLLENVANALLGWRWAALWSSMDSSVMEAHHDYPLRTELWAELEVIASLPRAAMGNDMETYIATSN